MPYLSAGKSKLYYEEYGDGIAIVLAHGVGGNHAWHHQVPHFAKTYRVVVIDQRGFGRSEDVEGVGQANYKSVVDILNDWDAASVVLTRFAETPKRQSVALSDAQLLAPVAKPGAIYCLGANYHDHAFEMRQATGQPQQPDPHALGLKPWFFVKSSHAIANPNDTINISNYSTKMDWELEPVAVIGRKAPIRPISI